MLVIIDSRAFVCSLKTTDCLNSFHDKQLRCCREITRCVVSFNISLGHSRSFKITPLSRC